MLRIGDRLKSFVELGIFIQRGLQEIGENKSNDLEKVIRKAGIENPWFTHVSVTQSLEAIASWLQEDNLNAWVKHYHLSEPPVVKNVAVVMAGNIPLVNFHDFLSVLISGHHFIGKLSSQDKVLLPFLADQLIKNNAGWSSYIRFTQEKLTGFDAVIATGSNNTSRYFLYYFEKYPHIIRKNRNSVAILTGSETNEDLKALYADIFQYYGMGCRNVSFLLVPKGYHFPSLFGLWEGEEKPIDHNKYRNNYDYYRSLYLVNNQSFFDTGYVSVIHGTTLASPISVIHYQEYADEKDIQDFLSGHKEEIQCLVSIRQVDGWETVPPGNAQCPAVTDYPDRVDIIQFLLAL